jgi:hypothetical protein
MMSEKAVETEGLIFGPEDDEPEAVKAVDAESLFYGIEAEPEALCRLGDLINFRADRNRRIEPQVMDFLSKFLNEPWKGMDAFRALYLARLFLRVAVVKYPGLEPYLEQIEALNARVGELATRELRRRGLSPSARDAG